MDQILKAAQLAARAHAQQKRKTTNEPYINHPIRVAYQCSLIGLSSEAIQAAFLHDVIEDTSVTQADLENDFSPRVVELVLLLTQWWPDDAPVEIKRVEVPKYLEKIAQDPEAVAIKLLDRADNVFDLAKSVVHVPDWATRYFNKSELEMKTFLENCIYPLAIQRFQAAMVELKKALTLIEPFNLDKQLPKEIFESIITFCKKGNEHFSNSQYKEAGQEFVLAMQLIPAPQEIWHASIWLTVAIGECHFLNADYANALIHFLKIKEMSNSETLSPLVHLRLAQCFYKLGQIPKAEPELRKSGVPYDVSELDHTMYWDIIKGISIRDDSLPFNTLA